jgi:hypothetical protein
MTFIGRVEKLAYSVSSLPGLFNRTKLIQIIPHFIILNLLDEDLEVIYEYVYVYVYMCAHIRVYMCIH